MLSSCEALEMMALTEKQQKVQVFEKQPGKKNRVKVGVKESFNKKLARSRLIDMGRLCGKNGRWKTGREQTPRK